MAHHTDCTFIRVSGAELVQKYIGEVGREEQGRDNGEGGTGSEGREGGREEAVDRSVCCFSCLAGTPGLLVCVLLSYLPACPGLSHGA